MPIRRLTLKDKDQVLALDKVIFSVVDPQGGWRESDFNQFFNEESCYVFYDEERPEIVLGYIFATQEGQQTYISNLGSDPRSGVRGIGTALMEKVMLLEDENSKKSKRPFAIKLHVDHDNETAIRFYKNLGFKEEGHDRHGIKMTATELPEKFKRKELLPSAPRPRKALIIRNIEGIQYDDLKVVLDGLEPNEQAPQEFNELIKLIRTNAVLSCVQLELALDLFKLEHVRDYIYETVKAKTGNHVIYHLNGLEDRGVINNINVKYITDKLEKIPSNTNFDLLYLGGGHGDPVMGSSNLSRQQLGSIKDSLTNKSSQFSAIVLGSCFSTAYLSLYQPLLKEGGVTISNSLECGGDNNFKPAMTWMTGQRKEFYSTENLRNSITITPELRSALRRVLEGRGVLGEELRDDYNNLLEAYKKPIREELGLPEEEIYDIAGELFNTDLERFLTAMQIEMESLNKEKVQELLKKYPKLDQHIQIIANKKGEETVFNAIINCIQPPPTALVVGTSKSLTMFNFSVGNAMPLNVGEDFKENYRSVRNKVERPGLFSEINEVSKDFNDISARKQFNGLFVQAIESTKEQREAQERLVREQQQREAQERLVREQQQREARRLQGHGNNQRVFAAQLKLLQDKIDEFDQRPGTEKASQAAHKLYEQLDEAGAIYFSKAPTMETYGEFKSNCDAYIKEARKELDQHRDWSEFLTNLALAIGTLGIGLLVKGAINVANNRAFFFAYETDSSKKIGKLEEAIDQVAPIISVSA